MNLLLDTHVALWEITIKHALARYGGTVEHV